MFDLPSYLWLPVLVGVVGMPTAVSVMLYRGALAAGLPRRTAGRVAAGTAAATGGWLLATALLARAGAYRQDATTNRPWFGLALLAALAAPLLATRIPVLSRTLAAPGTAGRLAVPQALRVVGGLFLIVFALGKLPAVFALPAGLGDMAVGLSAPFVARRLARGEGRRRAVWFNLLGILDLVVAVTFGALAADAPHRILAVTPSTEALTLLPLALIPTAAVPLAAALHVVSLRRLLGSTAPAPTTPTPSGLVPETA